MEWLLLLSKRQRCCPGETMSWPRVCDRSLVNEREANQSTEIPIGRLGKPEEIAETVIWMVKTGYVTNKVIGVDGGFFAQ